MRSTFVCPEEDRLCLDTNVLSRVLFNEPSDLSLNDWKIERDEEKREWRQFYQPRADRSLNNFSRFALLNVGASASSVYSRFHSSQRLECIHSNTETKF